MTSPENRKARYIPRDWRSGRGYDDAGFRIQLGRSQSRGRIVACWGLLLIGALCWIIGARH